MRNKSLVKTPTNANVKSVKIENNSAASAEKTSEKKLRQARLPFQILPSPGDKAVPPLDGSIKKKDAKSASGESQPKETHRKRRLSYDAEEDNQGSEVKVQRRSESKENFTKDEAPPELNSSPVEKKKDDAIVILSDDDDNHDRVAAAEEKSSKAQVDKQSNKKATGNAASKNKSRKSIKDPNAHISPRIQIKITVKSASKNKRKKLSRQSLQSAPEILKDDDEIHDLSTSDHDEAAVNAQHTQKKPKLEATIQANAGENTVKLDNKENEVSETVILDSEDEKDGNVTKSNAPTASVENVKDSKDDKLVTSLEAKKEVKQKDLTSKNAVKESKPKATLETFFKNINNNKTAKRATEQPPKTQSEEGTPKGKHEDRAKDKAKEDAGEKEKSNGDSPQQEAQQKTPSYTENTAAETEEPKQAKGDEKETNEVSSTSETPAEHEKKTLEGIKASEAAIREPSSAKLVEPAVRSKETTSSSDSDLETDAPLCSDVNNKGNSASESSDVTEIPTDTTTMDTSFREKSMPHPVPDTPIDKKAAIQKKALTPKQQKLLEQRRKAREEKERKLQEERLKKQKEKEERELCKKREREEREEQRRKEREEKEELRRKERDEKERKRLAEVEAKNEEKRKRNEAKEEEVRKKEEERKRKEQEKGEAELKKKKAAEAFSKFFAKAPQEQEPKEKAASSSDNEQTLAFRPFQVKGAMKLAPVIRANLNQEGRSILDALFHQNNEKSAKKPPAPIKDLYLQQLKMGKIKPGKWRRPSVESVAGKADDDGDDIMIVEDELERAAQPIVEEAPEPIEHLRAKYFKFYENRRPPYRGTWRKKSNVITPTRPFAQDKEFFDYEVDSDAEWEEEEPGESLDGSDEEKDKESEDEDYEVDNEWFVPHGHLSEEEMQNDDELLNANDREAQKVKMQLLQQEFAQQMKKKTEKIKPRLIGCIWVDENGNQPEECPKIIWDTLNMRAIMSMAVPPLMAEPEAADKSSEAGSNSSPDKADNKPKPIGLTKAMLKDLIRLVHGNVHSRQFLIKEFIAHIEKNEDSVRNGDARGPLKSAVHEKIDEYAQWQVIENFVGEEMASEKSSKKKKNKKHLCWLVSDEVLERMGLQDLSIRNQWQYVLDARLHRKNKFKSSTLADTPTATPNPASEDSSEQKSNDKSESEKKTPSTKAKRSLHITSFAKVLSAEEKAQSIAKERESSKKATHAVTPKEVSRATGGSGVSGDVSPRQPTKKPTTSNDKGAPAAKKRVPLLMSVARGQAISTPDKNACISQYLKQLSDKKTDEASSGSSRAAETLPAASSADVVVID